MLQIEIHGNNTVITEGKLPPSLGGNEMCLKLLEYHQKSQGEKLFTINQINRFWISTIFFLY